MMTGRRAGRASKKHLPGEKISMSRGAKSIEIFFAGSKLKV